MINMTTTLLTSFHRISIVVASTVLLMLAAQFSSTAAFAPASSSVCINPRQFILQLSSTPGDKNNLGVIDLTDDEDDNSVMISTERSSSSSSSSTADKPTMAAPFLSQGELSDDPNLLNPDFTDPKQTRVIIYIILTLVPVLFLIPLMIGSRDLIPLDALPPVELN
ncbi:hypothetical protein ACHAXM_001323 [Skeletonema potamos]|jgi:hypothetical protein